MRGFRCARDAVLGLVAALLWQGAAIAACEPPGTLSRVDIARLDQIAGASGAARRPLAAFADGDLVYAVFEKLAAIVVPPPLSGAFAGTLAGDQTTTVMLRRSRTQAFAPAVAPRIRDAGVTKVVPVSRSDEHFVLQNGFATYVVLPGTSGVSAGACIDDRAALLASRDSTVVRLVSGGRVRELGGERSIEAGATRLLLTACCDLEAMRPDDIDLDPRQVADAGRFARYLAAERFAGTDLSVDWTAAGRIAHEVLMQGRTQEAAQVLARLGGIEAAAAAPAVAMLADLASLGARVDMPAFPPTPSSVRESRARIGLARNLLSACRDHALDGIADRRVDFAEVLPDLRVLPTDIATAILLCDGRRLALAGDTRAALTRLRATDRPAGIEDNPQWLVLDAFLLARAGQEELSAFRKRRLRELLAENGERIDLRPMERFASPVELLGDEFVASYLAVRGGSFGDRRIDVAAMSSAIASLPPAELAARIDNLASWRRTIVEPALAARIDRAMARRLLGADGVDVAGSPTHAFQVASLFAAAPHLRDVAQEMRLASAGFAASAGLADAARGAIGEFLALGGPEDAARIPRFEQALDRYVAVRRAIDETALASDPVWQFEARDVALRAALAGKRSAVLAGLVGDALAADPSRASGDMPELRLLERLRAIDARP